jgi:hypothetical protein
MTLDEWTLGQQRSIRIGAGVDGPAVTETSAGAKHFNQVLRWMAAPFKRNRLADMARVAVELRAAIATG